MQLTEHRFMFHGSVVGLAGHIRRPQRTIFPSKGSAVVPSTGGYVDVEHCREHIPGLFSFSKISSAIKADFQDQQKAMERTWENPSLRPPLPTVTHVKTRVEYLTIAERLTIDTVALDLSSVHSNQGQPSFSSRGSVINGLRLDGHALKVHLENDSFSGSLDSLCRLYQDNKQIRENFMHAPPQEDGDRPPRFSLTAKPASEQTSKGDQPPRIRGYIVCSLVKSVEWEGAPHPDVRINRHIIHLPNFGYIYLGEMFVTENYRQITLVRVQLGSAEAGEVACAEGQVNGHGMP
jgi:hypothetical protein